MRIAQLALMRLECRVETVTVCAMNFWLALFAWLAIAAVLGLGILWASHGTYWLLILGMVGFIFTIAKVGCATD
jgi:hypothetical protein